MVHERESGSTMFSHVMRIFQQTPLELGKGEGPEKTPSWVERRKYPWHRYIEEIAICGKDKTEHSAMSFEISGGGMSAATPNCFPVGDQVELYLILGDWVKATVRRKGGAMYGFEFVGLTKEQKEKIRALCEKLPPFQSMADI
jgi:c-di-GMP-binding flagellar brake protein YcgR